MATPSINNMGVLNNDWGICGFTSSLYALYSHSPRLQSHLSSAAPIKTRMVAEIKTYLKMLEADGRVDLLNAIQTFTRSFGGAYKDFDLDDYVKEINKVVTDGAGGNFSIGMPPDALVDYLRRVCDFKSARILTGKLPDPPELILGCCRAGMRMYNGLAHYVYQLNGKIYSWGQEFGTIKQAGDHVGKTYTVGWKIALV